MINLLPHAMREDISYARRNALLLKWSSRLVVGIIGVALIVLGGTFYINQTSKTLSKRVTESGEQLKIQKLDETQKRVQDISGSLKLVVQVLGREILFSELLQEIGGAMPAGSSLASLSISKVEGGIDLNAVAKDFQTATQVQVNMQDKSNKIFDKADILNITCGSSPDANYPCQVSIRALFAKDNPFLYIHKSGAKT